MPSTNTHVVLLVVCVRVKALSQKRVSHQCCCSQKKGILLFFAFLLLLSRSSWTWEENLRGNVSVSHGAMLICVYVSDHVGFSCLFSLMCILLSLNSKIKHVSLFLSCVCECKCLCWCVCVNTLVCALVCMNACVRAQAGSGSPTMAAAIQDFQRSESDRLNEVKGHLEIALLEKHFLREYIHSQHQSWTTSQFHTQQKVICNQVWRPNVCWWILVLSLSKGSYQRSIFFWYRSNSFRDVLHDPESLNLWHSARGFFSMCG